MDISSAPPAPTITHRGDYLPPEWLVPEVSLDFALGLESTVVKAALQVRRNGASPTIRLKGDALKAEAVTVDGVPTNAWRMDDGDLLVDLPGEAHEIGIETRIAPAANTQLMDRPRLRPASMAALVWASTAVVMAGVVWVRGLNVTSARCMAAMPVLGSIEAKLMAASACLA